MDKLWKLLKMVLLVGNCGGFIAGEEETPAEETPAEETPPEEKIKITIDGEEQELTQAEIIALAQKGGDYTQKMQGISKKIGEETEKKTQERIQEMIDSGEITKTEGKKLSAEAEDPDSWEGALARIGKLEKTAKGYEEQSNVVKLEREYENQLKDLKGKYPQMNDMVVLTTLLNNPKASMEDVAKWSHEQELSKKDETIKTYLKGKKEGAKKGIESGRGATPLTIKKPITLAEAKAAAKNYLASQEE